MGNRNKRPDHPMHQYSSIQPLTDLRLTKQSVHPSPLIPNLERTSPLFNRAGTQWRWKQAAPHMIQQLPLHTPGVSSLGKSSRRSEVLPKRQHEQNHAPSWWLCQYRSQFSKGGLILTQVPQSPPQTWLKRPLRHPPSDIVFDVVGIKDSESVCDAGGGSVSSGILLVCFCETIST